MALTKLGPYRLEKVLGRGGMGAVYAGVNDETGERRAVKLLAPHLADDVNFRERFKIEIETLKKLRHPNIVQLHGFGEEEGYLFYVMELIEGRSLQDELASGMRFAWRDSARIGIQVARALKHAHDRGIIHRDLKPANLLLDKLDQVKLTDFGIAKLFGGSNITAEGGVIGTADYMPPEQAEGKPVTARSDLYSLGSVLYALLTGRPPFAAKTVAEVLHALRFDQPIAVRRLAPETPEEFESIILQLLEKDTTRRIPTAIALGNRLQAMEHALSLDTRLDKAEPLPPDLSVPHPPRRPNLTAEEIAAQQTAALPAAGHASQAGFIPTVATGPAPAPVKPSARTALHTGAAPVTGGSVFDESPPAAPEPEKRTHFTTVDEAEQRRAEGRYADGESPLQFWVQIAGLALVLLAAGLGLWWITRPATPDAIYARITAAGETGDGAKLIEVEEDIRNFIERFPEDERNSELKDYLTEIERFRMQRRFENKARRAAGLEGLAPVERAYLEAVRLAQAQPEQALARFKAIVEIYSPASEQSSADEQRLTTQCVQLAREQLARLEPLVKKVISSEQAAIRERLAEAERLQPDDAAAARGIWQGLVELYRDKPWAAELVADAQARLADSTASTRAGN